MRTNLLVWAVRHATRGFVVVCAPFLHPAAHVWHGGAMLRNCARNACIAPPMSGLFRLRAQPQGPAAGYAQPAKPAAVAPQRYRPKPSLCSTSLIPVFLFTWLCLTIGLPLQAQVRLSYNDYLQLVLTNHPLAQQADLMLDQGEAGLMAARGAFDPKIIADYDRKHFDRKVYFDLTDVHLKLPTSLYGLELKTSYERADGYFLNPASRLPESGLFTAGLSMPLGQGFMMDQRRHDLAQARIDRQQLAVQRRLMRNDLAWLATEAYWKYAFATEAAAIAQDALRIAELRLTVLRRAFELGDRMAMDTLEASVQVLDRRLAFNDALIVQTEAAQKLALFIWGNNAPSTSFVGAIPDKTNQPLPDALQTPRREELTAFVSERHPVLLDYDYKLAKLQVEWRLKREKLKPDIRLNYNFLQSGSSIPAPGLENYKFGLQIVSSTLFREGRGQTELTRIKQQQTQLERRFKSAELSNKLAFIWQALDNIEQQILQQKESVAQTKRLLDLEIRRFELGESTFFLINSRETKFLEAQVKLAKLEAERQILAAQALWQSGVLAQ